jgi:hypothetical protein
MNLFAELWRKSDLYVLKATNLLFTNHNVLPKDQSTNLMVKLGKCKSLPNLHRIMFQIGSKQLIYSANLTAKYECANL